MDTDRISIDNEITCSGTKSHQSILLLNPTKHQTNDNTYHSTDGRDETTFKKEDTDDLMITGAEVTQGDMSKVGIIMGVISMVLGFGLVYLMGTLKLI